MDIQFLDLDDVLMIHADQIAHYGGNGPVQIQRHTSQTSKGGRAYVPLEEDGWREAMCGSLTFYDSQGERLHTIYYLYPTIASGFLSRQRIHRQSGVGHLWPVQHKQKYMGRHVQP